nr:adenylate kinase family protein [Candidatus Sigynarchaeum springense]
MARILVISGTPGVGKSSIAKALAPTIHAEVLTIGELVAARHLFETWDEDRSTHVVDEERAREALRNEIERARVRNDIEWFVIEGLMADVVADECDLAIVLRLDPRIVKTRLQQRGYGPAKVAENVQSELLGTCTYHMREARGNDFLDLDTTGKSVAEIAGIIHRIVQGLENKATYRPGLVDWIARPDIDPAGFF